MAVRSVSLAAPAAGTASSRISALPRWSDLRARSTGPKSIPGKELARGTRRASRSPQFQLLRLPFSLESRGAHSGWASEKCCSASTYGAGEAAVTQPYDAAALGAVAIPALRTFRLREPQPGGSAAIVAEPPSRRILVVSPQPFYQDRGTPIATRQVLLALSELGRPVDLLTYPIGLDVEIPWLRIFRSGNPFRYESVPIGLSLRKIVLDLPITVALRSRLARERYACVH